MLGTIIADLKRSNKLLDETRAPVLDPVLGPALAGLIDRAFMRRDKLGELSMLRNDSKGSVRVGAKKKISLLASTTCVFRKNGTVVSLNRGQQFH